MIATETIRALGYEDMAKVIEGQEPRGIPIEVSAHHVHLAGQESADGIDSLFDPRSLKQGNSTVRRRSV